MAAHKTVDDYMREAKQWNDELRRLREIVLSTGLIETVKWGAPVYTNADGRNVVGIGGFKSYFGLWFFEGAKLADDGNLLINAQPGKTKLLRQWRMTSAKDLKPALVRRYVKEAAAL